MTRALSLENLCQKDFGRIGGGKKYRKEETEATEAVAVKMKKRKHMKGPPRILTMLVVLGVKRRGRM